MTYYIVGAIVALWLIGGIIRRMRRRGKILRVTEENCTSCGKCLKICHHNVLEMVKDEKGEKFSAPAHVVVKNPLGCTACGNCVSACKFKALELIEK
jgi:ferredoxin